MLSPEDVLLTDQVAIVTGGGQGIGEGIAINFAQFGAHVVIADKNAETAERTAERVRALGRKALGVRCDVRSLDEVEAMASQLARYVTSTTIHVDGGTWAASGWSRDEKGRWKVCEGFADAY